MEQQKIYDLFESGNIDSITLALTLSKSQNIDISKRIYEYKRVYEWFCDLNIYIETPDISETIHSVLNIIGIHAIFNGAHFVSGACVKFWSTAASRKKSQHFQDENYECFSCKSCKIVEILYYNDY